MNEEIIVRESFIVILDSRNATRYLNGTYNSNIIFEFEDAIKTKGNSIKMNACLNSFCMPNSLYIINEYNFLLSITILGITTNYNILLGNYNAQTFMNQLIIQLGSTFSITLNQITNQFTLINSTNDFIINSTSTIYQIMGFIQNTQYNSILKSITFPYLCNFNGYQNININIENINTENIDSLCKSNSSIIASIQIDSTLQQINYNKTNDFKFEIKDNVLSYIQLSLRDDLENLINLNNQHFNLTIQFEELINIKRYRNSFHNILNI